jgi:hypothetical protein
VTKSSNLTPDLIGAYEVTNFYVQADPGFTLNIGKFSEKLKANLKKNGADSAIFITAWNPFSKQLSDKENRFRNEMLKKELIGRSLKFLDGFGQDPAGKWTEEESFLVLGISLEAAKKLCNQFEQNAIVWSDSDAVPQLIMLR